MSEYIAKAYFDDGGWTWVWVKSTGHKWVRFVRLQRQARTERMRRARFDDVVDPGSRTEPTPTYTETWQRVTSAWRDQDDQGV